MEDGRGEGGWRGGRKKEEGGRQREVDSLVPRLSPTLIS